MDLRKLKTLIDLVSESNVSELEITEAEGKVRIVKGPVGAPVAMAAPVMVAAPVAAPASFAPAAPDAACASAEAAAPSGHVVKSPMVGTFYTSSSPDSKPFVKGGQDKKLVGYFQADTGMINQLVHLWKFDDDADRRAHWASVYSNKDFVEGFASQFRPLLASQEVKLLTAAPWGPHP